MLILALIGAALAVDAPSYSHYVAASSLQHSHGIAVVPSTGQVFIADAELHEMRGYDTMLTAGGGSTVSHSVSWSVPAGNLEGIEYDPNTDRLYVANSYDVLMYSTTGDYLGILLTTSDFYISDMTIVLGRWCCNSSSCCCD